MAKILQGSIWISILFLTTLGNAQAKPSDVIQDPKIESFAAEKKKLQSSITITDKYKIQLYSGEAETARKILMDFKKEFKNTDVTLSFQSPVYKVWAGSYPTKVEAQMALKNILKKFPKAFIFKPNKSV